ncbi:sucrase ferredoxin [Nitriliruptoraceae bacterium ZYF776]|nr:sucrase ferredoxin [Profundirhabdus halotolerans]
MREGCAATSRASGEPTAGTASRARRWLLVEHPGPWGADVLHDGTLPAAVADHLRELATALPARVLLIRRPVERRRGANAVFAGVTAGSTRWLEHRELADLRELVDLDLRPLGEHRSLGWEPVTTSTYLVCTNGRHDACCAELGRPVVDELSPLLGDALWECSHVGGDRFAGNLVVLPAGAFYGHLDPASARQVVHAHARGEVDLEHWRGWCDRPFPVQAAEAAVRARLGATAADALAVERVERLDPARLAVAVRTRTGGRFHAVVRTAPAAEARALTCGDAPGRPPTHHLESFEEILPGARG